MAHQHNEANQCHSLWFMLENTGQKTNEKYKHNTQTKHNPEKRTTKTQQNKTSLVQSLITTRGQERDGHLQRSRSHMGATELVNWIKTLLVSEFHRRPVN